MATHTAEILYLCLCVCVCVCLCVCYVRGWICSICFINVIQSNRMIEEENLSVGFWAQVSQTPSGMSNGGRRFNVLLILTRLRRSPAPPALLNWILRRSGVGCYLKSQEIPRYFPSCGHGWKSISGSAGTRFSNWPRHSGSGDSSSRPGNVVLERGNRWAVIHTEILYTHTHTLTQPMYEHTEMYSHTCLCKHTHTHTRHLDGITGIVANSVFIGPLTVV